MRQDTGGWSRGEPCCKGAWSQRRLRRGTAEPGCADVGWRAWRLGSPGRPGGGRPEGFVVIRDRLGGPAGAEPGSSHVAGVVVSYRGARGRVVLASGRAVEESGSRGRVKPPGQRQERFRGPAHDRAAAEASEVRGTSLEPWPELGPVMRWPGLPPVLAVSRSGREWNGGGAGRDGWKGFGVASGGGVMERPGV
jgi:hypothetical protein